MELNQGKNVNIKPYLDHEVSALILFFVYLDSFAMVVNLPVLIISKGVHVGMQEDNDEWEEQVKE